jgi:hypothetical protein
MYAIIYQLFNIKLFYTGRAILLAQNRRICLNRRKNLRNLSLNTSSANIAECANISECANIAEFANIAGFF